MQNEEMEHIELVALGGSGGGTPLFCFPGAGGGVGVFREMASLIADDHAVYGIDMQRFFDGDRIEPLVANAPVFHEYLINVCGCQMTTMTSAHLRAPKVKFR